MSVFGTKPLSELVIPIMRIWRWRHCYQSRILIQVVIKLQRVVLWICN